MTLNEVIALPCFRSDVHAVSYPFATSSSVPYARSEARYAHRIIITNIVCCIASTQDHIKWITSKRYRSLQY